jgi:hypothetical protein
VQVYKLTSASFPETGPSWTHAYAEGPEEISLPHTGQTRTIHVYLPAGGQHRLIDFTPGVGVSNARPVTAWSDMGVSFSNDPATPYFAYIVMDGGSTIRRFDVRTMTEVPGDGWPVTGETEVTWMHQAANDAFFTWMRTSGGPTVVGYEPATGIKKTITRDGVNEPRIDRAGRYVGLCMTTPTNALVVWDWLTNSVLWQTGGDPAGAIPFAHNASLQRRWMSVNWNASAPAPFSMFIPDVPNSAQNIGGPANDTLIYGSGNWIQYPADPNDQWALYSNYGSETGYLAPGGLILVTANGQRRLLGHSYNHAGDYYYHTMAKISSDGRYALFTSDMNGSPRSDLFAMELPSR